MLITVRALKKGYGVVVVGRSLNDSINKYCFSLKTTEPKETLSQTEIVRNVIA